VKYLFLVSVGPVQTFIASARRTRDLWFGSWLLSELSKAAAHEIVNSRPGNSLIFPAPPRQQMQELLKPDSELNVANKIVALIDGSPADLGDKVYRAIEDRLKTVKDQVFDKITFFDPNFHRATAEKQVGDLIEYFWVALPYENADYTTVRRNLEALLAARKNTRDFKQVSWEGSGVPKSSIDGQMESVIPSHLYRRHSLSAEEQQRKIKKLYDTYKAGPAEQLSGVDLLKRLGNAGEESHFPSTSHIAALPYLVRLSKLKDPTEAQRLLRAYIAEIRKIAALKNLTVMIDTIRRQYADWEHTILVEENDSLLYDGSLLFEERLVDIVADITGFAPAKEILRKFYAHVQARPIPYYAILVADGDFMGAAIDAQTEHETGPDKHREISQALAGFAKKVREIVKDDCMGAPVYAGGDDVLAFMPLHTVLECAQKLAAEFHEQLSPFPYDKNKSPTLSVGIAVAHHLDSLREALNLARNAEKQAKAVDGKNALAIRVSKRSGEERAVVGRWGELDKRLGELMKLYLDGSIPEGMSYELRTQARRLAGPASDKDLQQAQLEEAKRILQRKLSIRQKTRSMQSEKKTEELVSTLLAMLVGDNQQGQPDISLSRVEEFATELMVARTFADATELIEPQEKENHG
jgi:CRISPR-associated protein Cmr2